MLFPLTRLLSLRREGYTITDIMNTKLLSEEKEEVTRYHEHPLVLMRRVTVRTFMQFQIY